MASKKLRFTLHIVAMEFDYLLYTNHFLIKTQLIVGITKVKIEFIHPIFSPCLKSFLEENSYIPWTTTYFNSGKWQKTA